MEYLVIYDMAGTIISILAGDVTEPVGVPYMRVEIPEGKTLKNIDTSITPHVPVFEDAPKSYFDLVNQRLDAINEQGARVTELCYTAMEAVVSVYETVLPFLP